MREILFRGKNKVTGEMIQGNLYQHGEQCFIMADNRNTEVFPETVGQYTGLTDKNGVKIFEGDIIAYETPGCFVKFGTINFGKYATHAILSDCPPYNIGFYISWLNNMFERQELGFWLEHREIEIVGTIYDKPAKLRSDKN